MPYYKGMFLTNHALTGALIGLELPVPAAVPVAFASHFFMDGLPHFGNPKWKSARGFRDWHFLVMGGVDFTLACAVTAGACLLRPEKAGRIIIGAFFAALPDLFYIPEILFNKRLDRRLRVIHAKIQWSETPPGILVEGGWAAAMIAFLRHRH